MGIWIRSQNKEILTKCDSVWYSTIDNLGIKSKEGNYIRTDYSCLGSYSTKEKTIKVLDMIQSHLLNKKLMDLGLATSLQNDDIVFQMPQDDEV